MPHELHGLLNETMHESWTGREDNPGWKLDKWKFMPMMKWNLLGYPEGIMCYVFMEADSYLIWPTLLDYLKTLDHTKPYNSEAEVWIDSIPFAHGGSCFVVSRPAITNVVEYYIRYQGINDSMIHEPLTSVGEQKLVFQTSKNGIQLSE